MKNYYIIFVFFIIIFLTCCVQSDNIPDYDNIAVDDLPVETAENNDSEIEEDITEPQESIEILYKNELSMITEKKRLNKHIFYTSYPRSQPAKMTVKDLEQHVLGNGAKSLERLENDICIVQHVEFKKAATIMDTALYVIFKSAELYSMSGLPGNRIGQDCSYYNIHLDDEYLYFTGKAELWAGIEIECKFDLETKILYYDKEINIEAHKIWYEYLEDYLATEPQRSMDDWYNKVLQKITGEMQLKTHSFYNTTPKPQTVEEMESYVLKDPYYSSKRLENDICIVQYVKPGGVMGAWSALYVIFKSAELYEMLGGLRSLQDRVSIERFEVVNLLLDDEYLYFTAGGRNAESNIRIECKFNLESKIFYYNQEQYEAALKIWYEQDLYLKQAQADFYAKSRR
jgi:hypothetical protein